MARNKIFEIEVLIKREKRMAEKLKELRAKRRAVSRIQHDQRLKRIAELAEKAGLASMPEAALESEFRRIVAEQTVPLDSHRNLNTEVGVEANQAVAGDSSEPRRKWFGGS